MKGRYYLIILLLHQITLAAAQEGLTIVLKKEMAPSKIDHYHIESIKDVRTDKSTIGKALGKNWQPVTLDLARGAGISIGEFITSSVVQKNISTAADLHITELKVTSEKKGGAQQLALNMSMAFIVNNKQLIEYKIRATDYVRPGESVTSTIGDMISRNVIDRLHEFDGWWMKKQGTILIADTVRIVAVLDMDALKGNLIPYNSGQPLVISDFMGTPDPASNGDAATYSGIISKYDTRNENGQLVITARITPYFDKGKSWFRPEARNAKTLEHEQLHLDITAMKACELLQELNQHRFTLPGYAKELEQLFRQKRQEENELQNRYDIQSGHGRFADMQNSWSELIKKNLKKLPCFH